MSTSCPFTVGGVVLGAALLTAATAEASVLKFSEPDRYERWQHFKDYGVPGTLEDPLNRAAIADGTCRLVNGAEYTGFHFWHHPDRVAPVLAALTAAPATDSPSRFTLQAGAALAAACTTAADQPSAGSRASHSTDDQTGGVPDDASTFAVAARAAALDNWYRALCVPASSASWGDASAYDPAYMPAQVAITTGLACIVACDAAGHQPSRTDMANLAAEAISASEAKRVMPFCGAFLDNAKQGYDPLPFASVGSNGTLLKELTVVLTTPTGACGCAPASGFSSPPTPILTVVGVAAAAAVSLVVGVAIIYVVRRRRPATLALGGAGGSRTNRHAVSGSGHGVYADKRKDDEDAALLE